jgi:hypothetical protein
MRAMLTAIVSELTRPMNSSMTLGMLPAPCITVGDEMTVTMIYLSEAKIP